MPIAEQTHRGSDASVLQRPVDERADSVSLKRSGAHMTRLVAAVQELSFARTVFFTLSVC